MSSSITTDPYRILSEQKRLYQNLYKTNDSVEASDSIEAFLYVLKNIPKLSEEPKAIVRRTNYYREMQNNYGNVPEQQITRD